MEDHKDSLEEKARKFLQLMVEINPRTNGFNPSEIRNLHDFIPQINYLIKNGYICEGGDTVKTFHYEFTKKCRSFVTMPDYFKIKSN